MKMAISAAKIGWRLAGILNENGEKCSNESYKQYESWRK